MFYKVANGFLIAGILLLIIYLLITIDLIPLSSSFTLTQNIFKNVNESIEKEIASGKQGTINTTEAINLYEKVLSTDPINTTFCQNLFNNERTLLCMDNNTLTQHNNKALRLTFSYEGNNIRLISQQKIDKLLPPSGPFDNIQQNQTGFWYELSDSSHNILYRQVMNFPIKNDTEVFSKDPKESIIRQKITDIRGTFSILIPDIPQANNFDMFSSPISSEGVRSIEEPPTKIFHLNLNER
jgi:hypothetical protein